MPNFSSASSPSSLTASFKSSIGYHIATTIYIPIKNRISLIGSATYHIVNQELDNPETVDPFSAGYDGGKGWYYNKNEYSGGHWTKSTQIYEMDSRSGSYNNFCLKIGINLRIL